MLMLVLAGFDLQCPPEVVHPRYFAVCLTCLPFSHHIDHSQFPDFNHTPIPLLSVICYTDVVALAWFDGVSRTD